MTSAFNKKLPLLAPKEVIGIQRPPNRKDLNNRNNLQGLPDPDPQVVLHRAVLDVEQAALKIQQAAIDMNNESTVRDSLTVLADPEASWSDSEWDTTTDVSPETDSEDDRALEDAFIAKVGGVEVEKVSAARGRRGAVDMQAFVRKVRGIPGRKATIAAGRAVTAVPAVAASSSSGPPSSLPSAPASAPAPAPVRMQPGTARELTTAQAALALTNAQAGTIVTMDELRTVREIGDDEVAYPWTVGTCHTRELTVAEAALLVTNMQAGTDVTMQDLRTAREMVDLWDNADIFQWTVGNVE